MGWKGRLAAAAAATLGAAFLAVQFIWPRVEYAPFLHEVTGVDVSAHQGAIDWDRLAADGVAFAYIKASEGETFNDSRFSRNWYGAEQAGILRGAYHFFTQCRTGKQQAENFIRIVPEDAGALPPVVDAEHMGPCSQGPAVADVAAEIAVFLDTLQAHYGSRPVIYTTRRFHDAFLAGKFAKERFWIRSLLVPPRFRQEQRIFWQYHNSGRRSGVSGPVDLNVFKGSLDELKALRQLGS